MKITLKILATYSLLILIQPLQAQVPTDQEWQTIEVYREINEAELANLSPELTQNLITSGEKKFLKGEIDIFLREYSKPYLLNDGQVIRDATDTNEPFMWEHIDYTLTFYLHEPNMAYETWLAVFSKQAALDESQAGFEVIKATYSDYDAYKKLMGGVTKFLITGEIWIKNEQSRVYCKVIAYTEQEIYQITDGSYTVKEELKGQGSAFTYILEDEILKNPSLIEYKASSRMTSLENIGKLPVWWSKFSDLYETKVGLVDSHSRGSRFQIKATTKEEIFGAE